MKSLKNILVCVILVSFMVIRFWNSGNWISSLSIWSMLVTWFDTLRIIVTENKSINSSGEKTRFGIISFVMISFGIISLVISIIHLTIGVEWLNEAVALDEITLFSLLICLTQKSVVSILNKIIHKEDKPHVNA